MSLKQIHRASGTLLAVFIILHLGNHISGIFGESTHIMVMDRLRVLYRNRIVETLLLLSVVMQIVSGLRLYFTKRGNLLTQFDKIQIWAGLYLSFFLLIHLTAVLAGRFVLDLDTNLYFGSAGINTFPFSLFFIPYYSLAIVSVFGHVAAVHNSKMKMNIAGLTPLYQSRIILAVGVILCLFIFFGLTNQFQGMKIPSAYNILIGK